MKFGAALEALEAGKRVARAGWNGKGMFLFLVPGSTFTVNRAPLLGIYPAGTSIDYHAHIDMKTAQGYVVPWLASQSDLLTDDWEAVVDAAAAAPSSSATTVMPPAAIWKLEVIPTSPIFTPTFLATLNGAVASYTTSASLAMQFSSVDAAFNFAKTNDIAGVRIVEHAK